MKIKLKKYTEQAKEWSQSGYHIMAQYNDEEIIVYQSYRKEIGEFAIQHQYFGGAFSLSRMTWIKPNFLWMMFRNGWGTKQDQEVVLAIHLKRTAFENYLQNAVYSSYEKENTISYEVWQQKLQNSSVRLQWDPDHDPHGNKLERRAIQIGLKDAFALSYAKKDILLIEDVSHFVAEQYQYVINNQLALLETPEEKPLLFTSDELNKKMNLKSEN
jgi:hypothetical protein